MQQANHSTYLWSERTKTMWKACQWHTNYFHLIQHDPFYEQVKEFEIIQRINFRNTTILGTPFNIEPSKLEVSKQ